MQKWKIDVVEPSVDDLLDDEIMIPVMRSAGLNAEELRLQIRRAACVLQASATRRRGQRRPAAGCSEAGIRQTSQKEIRTPTKTASGGPGLSDRGSVSVREGVIWPVLVKAPKFAYFSLRTLSIRPNTSTYFPTS